MKVFLSALEQRSRKSYEYIVEHVPEFEWNLMSYYYIQKGAPYYKDIIKRSKTILIDSGAHSFQKGAKVDWFEYTKKYAEWIKEHDCDKIIGYFEMDVDNVIGYDNVLKLRAILESVSNKIIPVWHKNRGIENFVDMCKQYSGKIVAVTGFRNEDIKDDQYIKFLKVAKKYNCKVHCLGMTRKDILNKVPFDYTDSSSWSMNGAFGKAGGVKVSRDMTRGENLKKVELANYKEGMAFQKHFYNKWKYLHND